MDILDVIFRRRSIRAYQRRPVPDEILTTLLRAGMAAPSACNSQPWEFIVVTDPHILTALRERLLTARYNAPAAIVVCSNLKIAANAAARRFWIQDCSAAIENILIAATGMALGSVWIGLHPLPIVKRVQQILDIPEEVTPLGMVYVGYPDEEKEPGSKYDARRVHWQRYTGKPPGPQED
ncbi:MAG: nitroreductase family protein [Anaerolineae bacterium]|nr:nitroreductase family protein [Anaerolineae bacterium]